MQGIESNPTGNPKRVTINYKDMEELIYNNIGAVFQLNKAGELIQKRMKGAKVCDGLYLTAPDRTNFVKWIIEYNGVKWIEHDSPAEHINIAALTKRMPAILASIEGGRMAELNDYHKEIHRRIFSPAAPAIMELKQPERKKPAPLAADEKRVNVFMYKTIVGEDTTEKKLTIKEIAPHIYTHVYKLRKYGERVKIIFEIDGVYFQGADQGAYIMERENFAEICRNAYEHARANIADGAAKGMAYFIELAKRIELAATPTETPQISTETTEAANVSAEEEKREQSQSQPIEKLEQSPQPPKSAPQSRKTTHAVNYATLIPKARETARKQQNSTVRDFRTTHTISCSFTNWSVVNSPPYW